LLSGELLQKLLGAIESESLIFICGAGLSMAPPSNLPSAAQVAQDCVERYQAKFGHPLPPEALPGLETMATYFYGQHQLIQQFIYQVVNWSRFEADANPGHTALADFLECDVAQAVVTTNYDCLIERAAHNLGDVTFEAVIHGAHVNFQRKHSPLLKLHGCWRIDKMHTLWCADQLAEPAVRERIDASTVWMRANLQQRDIVVLGFWSDWPHIVQVLDQAVSTIESRMVVLVDPQNSGQLEAKAKGLWDWANRADFHHVQMSASDFLDRLRAAYSENALNKLVTMGKVAYEHYAGANIPAVPKFATNLSSQDLYEFRRRLFGITASEPVRKKGPDDSMSYAGAAVILLKRHGAIEDGGAFKVQNMRVRIVRGTQMLSAEQAKHAHQLPDPLGLDLTICAGGHEDGGAPADLIRSGHVGGIVRPGSAEPWITLEKAFQHFGIPQ
jgi:hypothetical protein